jgi:hypothetical protein
MANRTVLAAGPSESLQLSGCLIHGGFHPQDVATRLTRTSAVIDRRTPQA